MIFDSIEGQSEFTQKIYEKYRTKCDWFLQFDFDEYLEVFFEKGKPLILQDFLTNQMFNKCETILFNWLIYSDNNLLYYDNRTLIERFTEPNYRPKANVHVKSIIRGVLNKTIFNPVSSNHVPNSNLIICDSNGNKIRRYNRFSLPYLIYDHGYLKHFTTKTAEEYCEKMIRGRPRNRTYDLDNRVEIFFKYNKYTDEKLKIFENKFNRTFKVRCISPRILSKNFLKIKFKK